MVKFLIVRFSSIGDIVLTTPVLRHLKKQVEGAQIHFLTKTSFAPLLEINPYVDKVLPFDGDMKSCLKDLKEENYDYLIDLHHNLRTARLKMGLKRMDFTVKKLNVLKWLYVNLHINRLPDLHMVDRNLDTIRLFLEEQDKEGLDHFIPETEKVNLSSLPAEYAKGYVGIAIGAQHETKKLPEASLIKLLALVNAPVILLGGPGDQKVGENILKALPGKHILNACGTYSIHQSASLVQQSKLLISHDTGLMHIGAALGKKIISIWGNTVPEFGMYPYRPDPASILFEQKGLKCRPCSKIGHQKCPKKHFKCMLDQDLEHIAAEAERLFTEP